MSRKWSRTIPRKAGSYYIHIKWKGYSSSYCEKVWIDEEGHAYFKRESGIDEAEEKRRFKDEEDRFWFIGPIEFPEPPDG